MSEQKTEFERSVAIREGHKIHSETSYFTPRPQLDFENARHVFGEGFDRGYIAATAEANKRIDALNGEIAELESQKVRHDQLVDYLKCGIAEELEQRILELQASNNDLREALIVCKQYITEAIIDDKYHEASCGLDELYLLRDKAINLYNAAISAPKE